MGTIKDSRALTLDKIPSNAELKMILSHLPLHGKALYLSIATSGMRISEAMQIRLEDLNLDLVPARVNIRSESTKTGISRMTFISHEAKEAIKEWLISRSEYMKTASRKSWKYKKNINDPRLFPFTDNNAYAMWYNALKKAGLSEKNGATINPTMHPNLLRKFFRIKLGAIISIDIVEALMGQETHLIEVYRKYSIDDLAKLYKQGEVTLLILTNDTEIVMLRAETEEKYCQLQLVINELEAEKVSLNAKIAKLESETQEIKNTMIQQKTQLDVIGHLMNEMLYKNVPTSKRIGDGNRSSLSI